jgi:hypothetical protein
MKNCLIISCSSLYFVAFFYVYCCAKVNEEFSWCHPESRQNSSVYLETVLAPQLLKHCQQNGLFTDGLTGIDMTEGRPGTVTDFRNL